MKKLKFGLLVFAFLGLIACDDDDDNNPVFQGDSKEYDLSAVGESGVSGTALFEENEDGSTTITLELSGTTEGETHPAHIHLNSAAEGGEIAISLEPVDGDTGKSVTTVSTLDDETPITYEELEDFDGYINVHKSEQELDAILAQGDIGQNELTDESVTYDLATVDIEGVSGKATFYKRENDEALVVLELEGTTEGNTHPAHIHDGSVAEPGEIAISLNPVDGATGISKTNISEKNDETAITYEELLAYNGYINVHKSEDELDVIAAQGNVGANVTEE